jgi:hypothetical protein
MNELRPSSKIFNDSNVMVNVVGRLELENGVYYSFLEF